MTTLREAQKSGDLSKFIEEHKDEVAEKEKVEAVLKSMASSKPEKQN